jgi:hypothetical protein
MSLVGFVLVPPVQLGVALIKMELGALMIVASRIVLSRSITPLSLSL